MKKIQFIISFAGLLLVHLSASAQLLNFRIGSDVIVEAAVRDAIVLVESNYCIQDIETGQKYGRNGQTYFNVLHFLGCKTDKGIMISEMSIHPWDVDNLFDKYRSENKYKPLLDSTFVIRSFSSDKTETINLRRNLSFNNDSTMVCANIGVGSVDGLTLTFDHEESVANWIIWVKDPVKNDPMGTSGELGCTIIKKTIDFSMDDAMVDPPSFSNSYLGGLYVSAKVINVGLVELSLSGFIVGTSDKWIALPVKNETCAAMGSPTGGTPVVEGPGQAEDGLTPVGNKKEEKK